MASLAVIVCAAGIPARLMWRGRYCPRPVLNTMALGLAMNCRSLTRKWYWAALCGILALAIPASADTAPQGSTAQQSKKKTAGHLASTSKTPNHHAPSHSGFSKTSAHKSRRTRSKAKTKPTKRGQKAIDGERARQIQEALIREHYLEGEPSGNWDSATQAAMQRYQADQGWQTKTIPDSRALIKLGLGPSPEHLLNPESAMTSSAAPVSAKSEAKRDAVDPPASPSSNRPSDDPPQR
jgi:hypothetical protein